MSYKYPTFFDKLSDKTSQRLRGMALLEREKKNWKVEKDFSFENWDAEFDINNTTWELSACE